MPTLNIQEADQMGMAIIKAYREKKLPHIRILFVNNEMDLLGLFDTSQGEKVISPGFNAIPLIKMAGLLKMRSKIVSGETLTVRRLLMGYPSGIREILGAVGIQAVEAHAVPSQFIEAEEAVLQVLRDFGFIFES